MAPTCELPESANSLRHRFSMLLHITSPGEFLKIQMNRPHYGPIESVILKALQVMTMNTVGRQSSRAWFSHLSEPENVLESLLNQIAGSHP